ncbi:uncharacterized protein [Diadema antillarum]|uniref:uncharacterized protein n=1 Tax=Diadema antillarum TaxID=105358 RepID=UPI003A85A5E8
MSIILAIAILGNVGLILIILTDVRLRTVHNKMVINLAACGLFTVVANGPFILSTLVKEEWIYGDHWCQFNGFTTSVYGLAVVLTLAIISINRYQIIGPVTRRQSPWVTNKRIPLVVAGIWIVSMLFALPPALGWSSYEFVPDRAICTLQWSTNISYTVFVFSLGIFFPFIVIFVSYFKIFRTVQANFRRMRSHRGSGKVYPRGEGGGAGSSRRPSAVSSIVSSIVGSSWSPDGRYGSNAAGRVTHGRRGSHLQPPLANGHMHPRRSSLDRNGRQQGLTRTGSDTTGAVVNKRCSSLVTNLTRQLSLDNDVIMISPCVSASTLDNEGDPEPVSVGPDTTTVPNGRFHEHMVKVTDETTKAEVDSRTQTTADNNRGSRLYKKREQNRLSGKISIHLTSVDEPTNLERATAEDPVGALSLAIAESNRNSTILNVQSALSTVSSLHASNLTPIPNKTRPCSEATDNTKTTVRADIDKINNNSVRRLSVRSLRHSFRPPSARERSHTTSSHSSVSASSSNKDELRMTLMVCAVLISFILCWAPVTIVSFIAVLDVEIPGAVNKFAVFMMFLSSAVNPVIYGLMNQKFRIGFTRLLCGWRTSKNSSNGSNRSKSHSRHRPVRDGLRGAGNRSMCPDACVTSHR